MACTVASTYTCAFNRSQKKELSKSVKNPNFSRNINRSRTVIVRASDDGFAGYSSKKAFLFPGQGAQSVGMAKDVVEQVPKAKELFDKAEEILGYDLLSICIEGPAEKLNSTMVSQPAIYVSSLAAVEQLRAQEGGQEIIDSVDVAAGLSLGEYTALAFAGAISFEDGLRIVKARGEAMQAASDAQPSGMVSVIGLDSETVQKACAAATEKAGEGQVAIANYLCNGNYACSGSIPACEALAEIAKPEFKARMVVKLAVAGAFHTDYMAPAVAKLEEVLASTEFVTPRIPVVSNVDAQPHSDPDTIKSILAKQVTCPVQWETSMKTLLENGLEESYELGPGKVIAGIFKRIDKKAKVTNITV
mmetsp:Transcript_19658/g.27232  ORF Transcript_19658/g.27232 Transcript_19658/m.27232 type:complete len:361 (-) Transcript_19658:125-1207(-)|eukprot:CAMPEP_0196579362 /NCGR_PEP_ID=MMETSP1081-20130531/20779_1 /TAXON_ID=36882 /ORGANISM="Pyramimonas amylifera, Strain CCMP720" /LENGTH=360 /DNA_ID=CAMNT_0041898917 /DNA_START=74 /DNA_END=1156 /DNA_ORIENTATION=+